MAGRRAMGHDDLRHFHGGVTSAEDLRVGKADGKGIRPSLLRMLFRGGSADRQLAHDDTRHGRRESVKPRTMDMLFGGGQTADKDLRVNDREYRKGDQYPDRAELDPEPPLFAALEEGGEVHEGHLAAAEDVIDAMKAGKPEHLARSLKAFFDICKADEDEEYDE